MNTLLGENTTSTPFRTDFSKLWPKILKYIIINPSVNWSTNHDVKTWETAKKLAKIDLHQAVLQLHQ